MKGFSVAVALLVSAGVALAGRHHEKRTTHTGRVSLHRVFFFLCSLRADEIALSAPGSTYLKVHSLIFFNVLRLTRPLPKGNDACGQPVPDGALAVHVSKDIWNNGKNCGQVRGRQMTHLFA